MLDEIARPFVKWAGGKSQLLQEIEKFYPFEKNRNINKYAEPFVGGGAVLFDVLNKFDLKQVYISDINAELINTYGVIRDYPDEIINGLQEIEVKFLSLEVEKRKEFYYEKRNLFNSLKEKVTEKRHKNVSIKIELAVLFIFLNRTCFNGLYRVNRNGDFNVPMGSYKNPQICNKNNLRNVSKKLQNVEIKHADYKESIDFIDEHTFVYFDPPYRPLTPTSNFTSYTEYLFDDAKQLELANFVQILDNKKASIVVSNSDPKNTNEHNEFFDEAYSAQYIHRVSAHRMINSNRAGRGKINELLISNF